MQCQAEDWKINRRQQERFKTAEERFKTAEVDLNSGALMNARIKRISDTRITEIMNNEWTL